VALSHGGGTLGLLLPRLQHAWQVLPAVQAALAEAPTVAARRMFYDSLVYDNATLLHLIQVFGGSQILVGSDYPFAIQDPDPAGSLLALGLPAPLMNQLRHQNARRWLGLPHCACAAHPST
jgi:aminocarboxymuconate-semialdehyde decarboxylase